MVENFAVAGRTEEARLSLEAATTDGARSVRAGIRKVLDAVLRLRLIVDIMEEMYELWEQNSDQWTKYSEREFRSNW